MAPRKRAGGLHCWAPPGIVRYRHGVFYDWFGTCHSRQCLSQGAPTRTTVT